MRKRVNTHGLTIKGLKETSGATCKCVGDSYFQIVYDMDSKLVFQCYNWTRNEWQEFKSNILVACSTTEHMTMQEIADRVKSALDDYETYKSYTGEAE